MEAAAGFAMDWAAQNAVAFDTKKDAVWIAKEPWPLANERGIKVGDKT